MKLIVAATVSILAIMILTGCAQYGYPDWQEGMMYIGSSSDVPLSTKVQ